MSGCILACYWEGQQYDGFVCIFLIMPTPTSVSEESEILSVNCPLLNHEVVHLPYWGIIFYPCVAVQNRVLVFLYNWFCEAIDL